MKYLLILCILIITATSNSGRSENGSRVYFLYGATDGFENWEATPFNPRGWFTRNILDLPYSLDRFDLETVRGEIWEPIIALKKKNYDLIYKSRISALDFLNAISDPKAIAVFYNGHGVDMNQMQGLIPTIEGHRVTDIPNENAKNRTYITVFEDGIGALLTPQKIAKAKEQLSPNFSVSANLELIFIGACFGSKSKHLIQSTLELDEKIQMLSPTTILGDDIDGTVNLPLFGDVFRTKVSAWVSGLPQLQKQGLPNSISPLMPLGY